jgi:hypothetical protein
LSHVRQAVDYGVSLTCADPDGGREGAGCPRLLFTSEVVEMIQCARALANVGIGQFGVIGMGQKAVFGQLQVGLLELPEDRRGVGVMKVCVPHQFRRI